MPLTSHSTSVGHRTMWKSSKHWLRMERPDLLKGSRKRDVTGRNSVVDCMSASHNQRLHCVDSCCGGAVVVFSPRSNGVTGSSLSVPLWLMFAEGMWIRFYHIFVQTTDDVFYSRMFGFLMFFFNGFMSGCKKTTCIKTCSLWTAYLFNFFWVVPYVLKNFKTSVVN